MSRWLEPEDAEAAAVMEEDEPESLWAGPLGMTIRLSLFTLTIFAVYLGVQATSKPVTAPDDVERNVVSVKPATRPAPTSASSVLPPIQPAPPRPVQGPDLPRRMSLEPQAFCHLIDVDKGANKWRRSPVYPDEWECLSSRTVSSSSKTSTPIKPSAGYTIFSMARGVGKTNIRHVRFKISASDPAGIETASDVVLNRLGALFKALDWPLPEHVSLAIRLQKPISIRDQGTTFQFVKERMSASSYNLIITFPKPGKAADQTDAAKLLEGSSKDPVVPPKT